MTWGHKWGGPNFSLSSVSSFPSDLLRAQRVDPAEKVSASRRIALGGVLRSKEREHRADSRKGGVRGEWVAWEEPQRRLPWLP